MQHVICLYYVSSRVSLGSYSGNRVSHFSIPVDDNDNENNIEADGVSTSASASASIIASASDVSISIPIVTEKVSSEEANFNAWIDKLKVQYK